MLHYKKTFLLVLLFIILITNLPADSSFYSVYKDYLYMMKLTGEVEQSSLNFHSISTDLLGVESSNGLWTDRSYTTDWINSDSMNLSFIPMEVFITFNSNKAFGMNDGAFWQGKGINTRVMGGLFFENDWLMATLLPEVWASQNSDFSIVSTSSSSGYGDYWTVFDNLQRYGDKAFYQFNLGQSGIRVDWRDYLTFGFSNENVVIGPGRENAILLGENASGFPHFDFGTDGAVPFLNWGDIDVRIIWGWLKESEFFDEDSSNDYGWFSGMYAAWSPSFYPNITIGMNHQYYSPVNDWGPLDLIKFFPLKFEKNSGVDPNDAMISVSFDWSFPEVGLNLYADWGRNDNVATIDGTLIDPEHTQGITVGLSQEVCSWPGNMIVFSSELSNLEQERTYLERAAGPWYRHGWAGWTQGFTNDGQLMGAAIGPGSNSQWVQLSWLHARGMVNMFAQRIAHDKDYYYELVRTSVPGIGAYVEVLMGLDTVYFMKKFEVYGNFTYSYSFNFNFIGDNNLSNIHLETGVRYRY